MIDSGGISHNHKLGVFTVVGTTGNPHAVKLFPNEKCTCASTSHCYHILAARMSVGLEDVKSKCKVNLTQLRRNTRPRRAKKSGRKAPQPGDYDIAPAPDANKVNSVYMYWGTYLLLWLVPYCSPLMKTAWMLLSRMVFTCTGTPL